MHTLLGIMMQTLPAWGVITLWACICAIASMFLYRQISSQKKLSELKAAQKTSRTQLRSYDGNMSGLYKLIGADLKISFKHMALVLPPTLIAIAPVIYILLKLAEFYSEQQILPWHYEWIGSAEILFLLVMLPISLFIKFIFKIN